MNNKHTYLAGALALILIAGGVYWFTKEKGLIPSITDIGQEADTATSTDSSAQGSGATTVTVGEETAAPVPQPQNYDRALTFPSTFTAEVKAKLQAAFDEDMRQIRATSDVNAWADLATMRKMAEDYSGSAEIWSYISKRYTTYVGPYAALGDLYANYLKDYPKAETNYLKVISLAPKNTDAYVDLYHLYTGPYPKSNTAAEDILKKGITANPGAYQLHVELARYYAGKGRTAEAKVEYDAAIAAAKVQNQGDIATQLEGEKAGL